MECFTGTSENSVGIIVVFPWSLALKFQCLPLEIHGNTSGIAVVFTGIPVVLHCIKFYIFLLLNQNIMLWVIKRTSWELVLLSIWNIYLDWRKQNNFTLRKFACTNLIRSTLYWNFQNGIKSVSDHVSEKGRMYLRDGGGGHNIKWNSNK